MMRKKQTKNNNKYNHLNYLRPACGQFLRRREYHFLRLNKD